MNYWAMSCFISKEHVGVQEVHISLTRFNLLDGHTVFLKSEQKYYL